MGEIGGSMGDWEICRKEPVMKMMDEHHFAGIPKGRRQYRCFFDQIKNYINLFQNLIIPGYVEGLDHDSHISSSTSADLSLRTLRIFSTKINSK